MIRLIMSDLDGTLLRNDKTVSQATIEALTEAKKHGILFGIATGRSLIAVRELIHTWGVASLCDVLVGMNGAQFMEMETKEVKTGYQLEGSTILEILRSCKNLDVNFALYEGDILYVLKDDEQARNLARRNGFRMVITDFKEVAQRSHPKMLILTEPEYMAKVETHVQSLSSDKFRGFKSDSHLFEFVHPLVSKSFGIRQVCDCYGFSMDEVMVFGDNDNDIEMIRDAGIGVCMANGTERAKAVAKAVALSNEEDGLAWFVMSYLSSVKVKG